MSALEQRALKPLTESKLPNVLLKGTLRYAKVKLDTALAGVELNLKDADFVWFDENCTAQTGATYSIDDESGPQLPAGPLRGFYDLPCKKLYFTCAALAGGVLNVWYGKGVRLLGVQPVGKGQWYDRNAVARILDYEASAIAPHGLTLRAAYTVPANKKFYLQIGFTMLMRDAVTGGAANEAMYELSYTPSGGSIQALISSRMIDNTLGSNRQNTLSGNAVMLVGDALSLRTRDLSTGVGTYTYVGSLQGIEFDA